MKWVIIGSGYGVLSFRHWAVTWINFGDIGMKNRNFHFQKCCWKFHLQNSGHFVQALSATEWYYYFGWVARETNMLKRILFCWRQIIYWLGGLVVHAGCLVRQTAVSRTQFFLYCSRFDYMTSTIYQICYICICKKICRMYAKQNYNFENIFQDLHSQTFAIVFL